MSGSRRLAMSGSRRLAMSGSRRLAMSASRRLAMSASRRLAMSGRYRPAGLRDRGLAGHVHRQPGQEYPRWRYGCTPCNIA
ncbi:MAG TPA: hypothetical protein VGS62_08115 [Streptosporangiaceae bacterium]|nr:hypothetical protein [Streptosporangiaceae bacterium]